ncbi:hypothetical protein ARMGADRAFT_1013537 [Armillaria gallica]|uniref:Uncharacterized protein n=1 Tax=Armillaria gallica TaxID=47427 RepID=A0A2H3DNE1_ARMGA|nr:hypothetical protein ARMGADRAFT_1013537 [Armillaria gallica]
MPSASEDLMNFVLHKFSRLVDVPTTNSPAGSFNTIHCVSSTIISRGGAYAVGIRGRKELCSPTPTFSLPSSPNTPDIEKPLPMSLLGPHLYSHPVEQDGLQALAFPRLRFPVGDYASLPAIESCCWCPHSFHDCYHIHHSSDITGIMLAPDYRPVACIGLDVFVQLQVSEYDEHYQTCWGGKPGLIHSMDRQRSLKVGPCIH